MKLETLLDAELSHARMREFAASNWERFKDLRGAIPQRAIAEVARVPQSYICNVERGKFYGIGAEALERIVNTYTELEHGRTDRVRAESGIPDVQGPRDGEYSRESSLESSAHVRS
jgi:hypothetical protein